jgi:hypothetical protein
MRNQAVLLIVIPLFASLNGCSSDSGITDTGGGGTGGGVADTLAPVVSITSPADGSGLPASLGIAGTATDDTEIDTVFFEARDLCGLALWSAHDLGPPYAATWDASGEQDGGYRVCMAAVDTAGNMSDWACVNVSKGTVAARLDGFWPKATYIGSRIKARGSGFGADDGSGRVSIFGHEATIEEWSDSAVTFVIPPGLPSDAIISMEVLVNCRWRLAGDIEIMPAGIIRLTDASTMEEFPCWNADGSMIYFCSTRSGNWDIWRIAVAGGEWQQVTSDPEPDFMPDIDPSSGEMAWMSERGVEGSYDIYHGYPICGPGGGCWEAPITADNDVNRAPAYSSQVYQGYSMVYGQFYDPDDDGSTVPTIFLYSGTAGHVELATGDNPSFSPNGRYVAYQNNDYEICTIEVGAGADPAILTTGYGDFNPHWGNNGRIVFHRNGIDGYIGLCVINPDGSGFETLLDQRWDQKDPAWSPDCSKIVFTGHRSGNFDIYVYDLP